MSVIKIENLWKEYRLGVIGHGTLTHDLQSWWAKVRGKEDPNARIAPMLAGQEKQIDGDHFWALRDINLEVKQGEILGIIGSNGAGKSTLLKILSRVTAPTKGNVKIQGRMASLLEVGTGFHPELTGRENVFMNGAILGMSKQEIKNKVDEIIDFAGVEAFIDTPVKRYSSGMRVRLGFSVAAHLEPEILVIDEVLAVGDADFQGKCLGKMDRIAKEGRTILFVSHNMASIQNLCTRGVFLRGGTISMDSSVENVVSKYLDQGNENSSFVELCNREDRGGDGNFRFLNVDFLDYYSEKTRRCVLSGDKIKIKISYCSKIVIENIYVAIAFFNNSGSFMCSCSSMVMNNKITINKGSCSVFCVIDKFPLLPGRYSYRIFAGFKNIILDRVDKAGMINVESGDYYKTGKLPPANRPGVLVDFTYK